METLKVIISILFITAILIIGLIATLNAFKKNSKTDYLKEILVNPKNYLNKEILIIGNVYEPTALSDYRENGIRYAISQEDKQGFYSISFKPYKDEWIYSGKYRVKGIIDYVDVCICEYKCVDYIGICIFIHTHLYDPHLNIRNFKTNLTSNPIKDFWFMNYNFYSKTIDYLCSIERRDYFNCSYEMKKDFDAFNYIWQTHDGIFYKEYRCKPNSLERVYYFEATEPMVKL